MKKKESKSSTVFDRLYPARKDSEKSMDDCDHDQKSEISDLASLVKELKRESLRHLEMECESQNAFEAVNVQMKSTRSTVGKLAEVLSDEVEESRTLWEMKLQEYQVESQRRLVNIEHGMERLEFRFAHHLRDCQVMADQVDRHQDGIITVKQTLSVSEIRNEKEMEEQKNVVLQIKMATGKAEERAALALNECSQRIQVMTQQWQAYTNEMDTRIKAAADTTTNKLTELDVGIKRYSHSLHQNIDDVIELRGEVSAVEALRTLVERHQKRFVDLMDQNNKNAFSSEHRWNTMDSSITSQRATVLHAFHVHELKMKSKLESLATNVLDVMTFMEKQYQTSLPSISAVS